MSMKRTLAAAAAAAMLLAQPVTALAATPGDGLTPQFNTGTVIDTTGVTTTTVVDATTAQTAVVPADATAQATVPAATTDASAAQVSQTPAAAVTAPGASAVPGDASQTAAGTTTDTSTGTAAAGSTEFPKIALDAEAIRPYMTTDGSGDVENDPVLNQYPLGTYFLLDPSGNQLDYGTTVKNTTFAYSPSGFTSLRIEQANVGRWYYRTYTAASGWGAWGTSNENTPSSGLVSAVQIRVKGYTHTFGTLYYRAVLNDGTLTDWAKEGQAVGVIGDPNRYIVALKVALWRKGVEFPYATAKPLDNDSTEGVVLTDEGPRYLTGDGRAYTGWGFDGDSNQYYFVNGVGVTGWQTINGYNIYFDENGVALKDLSGVMGAQSSYAIRINRATRTAYALAKDSSGNYTIPYRTMMVTVGDTPLGSFKIYEKYRWHFMHEGCYCQFLSRFYGHYLIHSLLYTSPKYNTFDANNYNYMDNMISGGCIRMKAVDAAWVYNNCPNGTTVTIYDDKWDKGPIEKDAIDQAIPANQNYDPTDPVVTGQ